MDTDTPTLPVRQVICHTEACGNNGYVVTFPCADTVICGGCGKLITDVTTVENLLEYTIPTI